MQSKRLIFTHETGERGIRAVIYEGHQFQPKKRKQNDIRWLLIWKRDWKRAINFN